MVFSNGSYVIRCLLCLLCYDVNFFFTTFCLQYTSELYGGQCSGDHKSVLKISFPSMKVPVFTLDNIVSMLRQTWPFTILVASLYLQVIYAWQLILNFFRGNTTMYGGDLTTLLDLLETLLKNLQLQTTSIIYNKDQNKLLVIISF